MKLKKYWNVLSLLLSNIVMVNAIEVIKKDSVEKGVDEGFRQIFITILTIGFVIVLFIAFLILFTWILVKIWKKLSEITRKQKHLIFEMFLYDMNQCHHGYDKLMKKKNWKLLWLFWKRRPVYIERENGELEIIGEYHGECLKKEGFYLIAIYNQMGPFKYVGQVIIIPLVLKQKLVKKLDGDGKRTLFLSCEGIDRIASSDYYFIPLIKDPKDSDKFIDFSNKIHKDYIELETYRDIITENLSSYKEVVIKSVETNPFVHFNRRGGSDFNKK